MTPEPTCDPVRGCTPVQLLCQEMHTVHEELDDVVEEQAKIHGRIDAVRQAVSEESMARLQDERDEARRFLGMYVGIGVTIVLALVNLLLK